MTKSITGMSITSDAFIPAICFSTGTAKGAMVTDTPLTNTRLNRFAPITLPSDKAPCPLTREVIAVTNSGSDVPRATKVSAITDAGTPRAVAIIVPLSTKRLAPIAIHAAPTTSSTRSLAMGSSSSASLEVSAGTFFACPAEPKA